MTDKVWIKNTLYSLLRIELKGKVSHIPVKAANIIFFVWWTGKYYGLAITSFPLFHKYHILIYSCVDTHCYVPWEITFCYKNWIYKILIFPTHFSSLDVPDEFPSNTKQISISTCKHWQRNDGQLYIAIHHKLTQKNTWN